jgi:voltage-gated potassium channel
VLMLTEGLNIFKVKAHTSLVGKSLAESGIRQETGCSVVALGVEESMVTNPDPNQPLERGTELILVGTMEAEQRFMRRYPG